MAALLFSGCGKADPSEEFFKCIEEFNSVREYESYQIVSATLSPEAIEALDTTGEAASIFGDGALSLTIEAEATQSASLKQAYADASMRMNIDGMGIDLDMTDVYIDGSDMYINISKIMKLVSTLSGEDLTGLFDADYISMNLTDYYESAGISGLDIWAVDAEENYPENIKPLIEQYGKLGMKLKDMITEAKPPYITEDDGVYTLTLDNEAMRELITIALTDIRDNAGDYYDAFIAVYENNPAITAYGDIESIFGDRDDAVASLSEAIDDLLENLDELPEMNMTMSVSHNSDEKNYHLTFEFSIPGMFSLSYDANVTETAVEPITPPEDSIPYDDLYSHMNIPYGAVPDYALDI